jgi:alpha-terpineol hydroxylase
MSATAVDVPVAPREIAEAVILPGSYTDLDGVVYPACTWLRENMPIARAEVEGYDPVWLITKHADNRAVLNDAELFHNADVNIMLQPKAGDDYLKGLLGGHTKVLEDLSYMEPPEHTDYRKAQDPAFTPAAIRKFEERLREIAQANIDRFLSHGEECDAVETMTSRFPLEAILELLGVPSEDYDRMLVWSQHTFGGDDPDLKRENVPDSPEAAARQWLESVEDFFAYFEVVRKDRMACPRDDLSSALINAKLSNGELMPPRPQNHMTAAIALAGHDTVSSSLSAGLHGLASFPEEFARVKADMSYVPRLVEESLRWASPAKHFMRNATRDTELHGIPIKAMDRLMCLYVSGNNDEEVFPEPRRFDITRRPNPHLSFSFGPHICLGLHIARFEMRVLFEELLPRIDSLELAAAPTLKRGNFVTGFKTLPLRFKVA